MDAQDPRNAGFESILGTLTRMDHALRPRHIFLENVKHFYHSDMHAKLTDALEAARYRYVQYLLSPMQLGIPNHRTRFYLAARKIEADEAMPTATEWAAMKERLVMTPPGFEVSPSAASIALEDEDAASAAAPADDAAAAADPAAAPSSFVLPKSWTLPCVLPPRTLRPFLDPPSSVPAAALASLILPASALAKGFHLSAVSPEDARTFCFTGGYGKVIHTSSGSFLLFRGPQVDARQSLTQHPLDKFTGQGLAPYQGSLRFFSPMELLRLFDFPAWYRFPAHFTLQHCYKLIGNSLNLAVVKLILHTHLHYALPEATAAANKAAPSPSSAETPPAARLVGVELNPGPTGTPAASQASSAAEPSVASQPPSPAAVGAPLAFVGSAPLSVVSLDVSAIVAAAAAVASSTSAAASSKSPSLLSNNSLTAMQHSSYIPPALGCSPDDEGGFADAHESAFIADYLREMDRSVSALSSALDSPALGPNVKQGHGRSGSGLNRSSMDFSLGLGLGSLTLEEEQAAMEHPSWGPRETAAVDAEVGVSSPAVPPMVRRVRSYSSSEPGHLEESFSPRNAALKSPKFGSSLSGLPMMVLSLAQSNSNRSSLNSSNASSSPPFHPMGYTTSGSSSASTSTSFDMIRQAADATAQRRVSLTAKSANPSPYSTLRAGAIRLSHSHRHSGSNPPVASVVPEEGSASYVLAPANAHETLSSQSAFLGRNPRMQAGLALHIPGQQAAAEAAQSGAGVANPRSDRASPYSSRTPQSPGSEHPSSEPSPGTPGSVYEAGFSQISSPSPSNRHATPMSPRIHLLRKVSPAGTAAAAAAATQSSASPTSPTMASSAQQQRSSPISGGSEVRRAISLTMHVRSGGSSSVSPSPHVLSSPSSLSAKSPGPPSPHVHSRATAPEHAQYYPQFTPTSPSASPMRPQPPPSAAAASAAPVAAPSSDLPALPPLPPYPSSSPPSPSLLPLSALSPPSPSLKGRGGRRILIHKNSRSGSIVEGAEEGAYAAAEEHAKQPAVAQPQAQGK